MIIRKLEFPEKKTYENVSYRVYWYSDEILKPAWIAAEVFDDLGEAIQYANRRFQEEKIKKTVVMKEVTTSEYICLKSTLNEKKEPEVSNEESA